MEHDRWRHWKVQHGLVSRGRPHKLVPVGFLGKLLYHLYFKHHEPDYGPQQEGGRVFKQDVGGTLGPSGKVNGA